MSDHWPKLDLSTFFLSVSSAALYSMGIAVPGAGANTPPPKINLPLAAQNIELLELLKSKTEGNRTADEDKLLDRLLYELRIKFVELKK